MIIYSELLLEYIKEQYPGLYFVSSTTKVPVSYTHLDVYKRQILINNAGVQNGDDIDVNLKGTISVTEHYGIHPNISVSYTHLLTGKR